jgi:osmotically-inducible protein OsmY
MKVHSEFVDEDVLSGSNIDVDVKNGVVTLQGTVPSEPARARALEVAKKMTASRASWINCAWRQCDAPLTRRQMAKTADKAADKMAKTADKAEDKMDKAGDKTASGAKKTGRAIDDGWIKSKIYAQYMADWNTVLNDSDIDVDVANNMVT